MRLSQFTSKAAVEERLEEGDEELRTEIDAFLEEAAENFRNRAHPDFDNEVESVKDRVSNDPERIAKQVIEAAREHTSYDLKVVPLDTVENNVLAYVSSFLYFDVNREGSFISLDTVSTSISYWFSADYVPEEDLAHLIPTADLIAFWSDLKPTRRGEWSDSSAELLDGNTFHDWDDNSDSAFGMRKTDFEELCRDIYIEVAAQLVRDNPVGFFRRYIDAVTASPDELPYFRNSLEYVANDVERLANRYVLLPDATSIPEELLDLAVEFYNSGDVDDNANNLRALATVLFNSYEQDTLINNYIEASKAAMAKRDARFELVATPAEIDETIAAGIVPREDLVEWASDWLENDARPGGKLIDAVKEYTFHKDPGTAVVTFMDELHANLVNSAVGQAGADAVKKALDEKHFSKEVVLKYAYRWKTGEKRSVLEDFVDYADAVTNTEDTETSDKRLVAEVSSSTLKQLGITGGALFEEAPLKLIRLMPKELAMEGRRMRHCVGNSPHYAQRLAAGEIEVWSLRDRHNKSLFTLEVNSQLNESSTPEEGEDEKSSAAQLRRRAQFISQLKGKANRTPGFDGPGNVNVTKNDEVLLWKYLLKKLHISPADVNDFKACNMPAKQADAVRASYQLVSANLEKLADTTRKWTTASILLEDAAFILAE